MTAETIARALGGHRAGATWMARCPAHDDSSPSLSISAGNDGKVLVRCHAGCDQRDLIAALQERGLWQTKGRVSGITRDARRRPADEPDVDTLKRSAAALAIWQASHAAEASGFDRSAFPCRPETSLGGRLARDGGGKAPVDPAKMMLGPCRGGVVRLGDSGNVLMVGEGIETCLAAMQASGRPAWAALSTSGLRSLNLPNAVRDMIVLADGDEPGEAAAQDCARRWKREGRHVRIARPPQGMDFNDLLKARNPSLMEGAR